MQTLNIKMLKPIVNGGNEKLEHHYIIENHFSCSIYNTYVQNIPFYYKSDMMGERGERGVRQ